MNKDELYNKLRVVAIVLMVISICLGAYMTYKRSNSDDNRDAIKFSKEYSEIPTDNMFIYKNLNETLNSIENSKGVYFFCTRTKEFCDKYALYLYEEAKDLRYTPVYYIDMKDAKEEDINKLKSITSVSDYPLIVVSDMKIKGSINIVYDKWDATEVESFKIEIMNYINKINDSVCQDDCK